MKNIIGILFCLFLFGCAADQFHESRPTNTTVYQANRECAHFILDGMHDSPAMYVGAPFGAVGGLIAGVASSQAPKETWRHEAFVGCMREKGWVEN